ncbi:MAG: hypothetical protein JXM69_18700 [Anaerolineae bacterium]|nr:hypothetical protein [Anaerolineae bacterium]
MTLAEERMQILKMLEEGKITADQAANLLAALDTGMTREKTVTAPGTLEKAKWLRVRVTDQQTGKQKVSVNVPVSLVNVALKIGANFVPELGEMESNQIMDAIEAIKSGAHGKIVDVEDDQGGERVEVFVE